jgi:hypothetical protein
LKGGTNRRPLYGLKDGAEAPVDKRGGARFKEFLEAMGDEVIAGGGPRP